MSRGDELVAVEGLVKTYPGGVRAVDGLSFSVASGEAYALLGRNGAGKTTAVRVLVGLLRSDAGTARVGGFDVAREPEAVRRLVGYAAQGAGVDVDLTVTENIVLRGRLHGLRPRAALERARTTCESLQLGEFADRRAGVLSGGQRRRLDLALALVHGPEVLLLDEPTTGLDPQSRRLMWTEVEHLTELGKAVLLTTQYLEEADRLCHRVGILDAGRLVAEGSPSSLKAKVGGHVLAVELASASDRQMRRAAAVLGRIRGLGEAVPVGRELTAPVQDPVGPVARALQALARARIRVAGVRVTPATLEHVYLHYTGEDAATERTRATGVSSLSVALTGAGHHR